MASEPNTVSFAQCSAPTVLGLAKRTTLGVIIYIIYSYSLINHEKFVLQSTLMTVFAEVADLKHTVVLVATSKRFQCVVN
jgi:hypothetical protein